MKINTLLTAAVLAATLAGGAQATTVTVTGSSLTPAGNNDFLDEMTTAIGALTFFAPSSLSVVGPVRLTFTAVGAESGLNNGFTAVGFGGFLENGNFGEGTNFLGSGAGSFAGTFAGGSLQTLLSFFTQGGSGPAAAPDGTNTQFGVFTRGTGPQTTVFLAFDDNPGNPDDNHDDFIVRMDVAAIPVPAAGLLLVGALGGLAALRRRKAIAA